MRGRPALFWPVVRGRPGKILNTSKGGADFFRIINDKNVPQKGRKKPFFTFLGGFSPLCDDQQGCKACLTCSKGTISAGSDFTGKAGQN